MISSSLSPEARNNSRKDGGDAVKDVSGASFLTNDQDDILLVVAQMARVLWKSKRLIFMATLVSLVAAAAFAFVAPTYYTAIASIAPPSSGGSSMSALATQLAPLGAAALVGGAKTQSDLYVGMLKSSTISRDLVSQFHLTEVYGKKKVSLAQKKLSQRSRFSVGAKDGIIEINVTDQSPQRARDIANAYIDELRLINERLALTDASQRRLFFQQQVALEKDALESAEVQLKSTQEASGLVAPAGQTIAQVESVARTQARSAELRVELAALRQSTTEENPEAMRMKSEIAELERQRDANVNGAGGRMRNEITSSSIPALALDYVRKDREVKYHEALFGILSRQYESARIDEAHQSQVIQVLDRAIAPDTASSPGKGTYLSIGLAAGVLAGCCLALLNQRVRDRANFKTVIE
jgi:uncharacterized protein involved in exopolysaccharide biosynthesis